MKVLQIHNHYTARGGEDSVVEAEARLLADAGHQVDTLRVRNPGGARAALALAGAPWNPPRRAELRDRLRADRPDVAHLHNTWFSLSPSIVDALADAGVPTVMTLHNYRLVCGNALLFRDGAVCTDCVGGQPWHAVRHGCYRGSRTQSAVAAATIALHARRGTWEHVTRFLAPSRFVRDVYVAAGFDASRITVKPHSAADPGPRTLPPSASRRVLCLGRLAPEKGIDTLLDAWRAAGHDDLELVLVGDGPRHADLARRAPDNVRFTGWLPAEQVRTQLLRSRAVVVPTECYETFGMTAVEGMAAGVPVLASDIAGPADVAGELGPAWLAPPGDVEGWSDALLRLRDDAIVDAVGQAARDIYLRRYTEETGLRSLLASYQNAIESARCGRRAELSGNRHEKG
ncbi:glycosyltransferase [Haloechinothrix salitolerans]|uniref:Glycosyltransferase n=1 Tax=Haloechinothrix salitolerans TaxID=926830 RepID=A0ABW2C4T6_9PSEU